MDVNVIENLETNVESEETIEVDVKATGTPGLSAYEIYLKNGGVLSEIDWLSSLNGEPGIQGPPGEDGYTPVRGTDYWTESDIDEIKEYCDSQITGVLGGSY